MDQNYFNFSSYQYNDQTLKNKNIHSNQIEHQSKDIVKTQRVRKLKDILDKNLHSKSFFVKRKVISIFQNESKNPQQNLNESSLPLIKINEQHKPHNNPLKYRFEKSVRSDNVIQNPQDKLQRFNKSQIKLKTKILTLVNQDKSNFQQIKRSNKPKMSKQLIHQSSIKRINSFINPKMKEQRQQKRRKSRNIRSLKLTKIQNLPQIIFAQNKKCSQKKFLKPSQAEIDYNILVNEIHEIERNCMIQFKKRQKNQRMLKEKIRNYQQKRKSYHSIGL